MKQAKVFSIQNLSYTREWGIPLPENSLKMIYKHFYLMLKGIKSNKKIYEYVDRVCNQTWIYEPKDAKY